MKSVKKNPSCRRGIHALFIIILFSVGWIISVTKKFPALNILGGQKKEGLSSVLSSSILSSSSSVSFQFHFPSPEDRVKYYMGDWYDRTLLTEEEINRVCSALFGIDKQVRRGVTSDRDILFTFENIVHQVEFNPETTVKYLSDALEVINSAGTGNSSIHDTDEFDADPDPDLDADPDANGAIILHHGDSPSAQAFMPSITKIRPSCLHQSRNMSASCSNIIWPLNMHRHYGSVDEYLELNRTGRVIAWDKKKSTLLFRGALTGEHRKWKIIKYEHSPRAEAAMATSRFNATDVDFGFSNIQVPDEKLNTYMKEKMKIEEQLQYKYLFSIEGNDVSSGLKWQLASNSVVFMAKPQTVSYAMEDLLVPFVHYIPLKDDFSDVMEMLEWARSNDEKCQWISEQATEFMNRLWISERAKMENELVKADLARRYQDQFGPTLQKCLEDGDREDYDDDDDDGGDKDEDNDDDDNNDDKEKEVEKVVNVELEGGRKYRTRKKKQTRERKKKRPLKKKQPQKKKKKKPQKKKKKKPSSNR